MKQVIQSARTGKLSVREVPAPVVGPGELLVRTRASLISAGTERMVVDFARKSLAGKAKARPDLVRKVMAKARRDGIAATLRAVMARLDAPLPLGYSAVGTVVAVGAGLEGTFRVGDRVAGAGAGIANHAEINRIPVNLAAPVPDGVTDEEACYGTLAAIAMHAVRNTGAGLGDVVAVLGVGLVGQMAAQLLALAGARVVAMDFDGGRLVLAKRLGAEAVVDLSDGDPVAVVSALTRGRGCDAVLVAAAGKSSAPFQTAAEIARDRARVVMVGMTGTGFPYADFMKKELSIHVSRSYGPGRYDSEYEEHGVKYPEGWVRWTETANLAECVRLMDPALARRLDVGALTTHRFAIHDAEAAYQLVTGGTETHLGVVLTYPDAGTGSEPAPNFPAPAIAKGPRCVLGVIGAGNFARTVLLPELKKLGGVELRTVATRNGASAAHVKETFGFAAAATDPAAVIDDPAINAVLIATRHDSHADLTARALAANKAVWVEKPLGLSHAEIDAVVAARAQSEAFFQIGFNRRFAPHALAARTRMDRHPGARVVMVRVNAGPIPRDSWVVDASEGGGRVLGEMCHFVDLARFLAGSPIVAISAEAAGGSSEDVGATLRFADGGMASIVYTALGDTASGKERIEVFSGGMVVAIDDFRSFTRTDGGKTKTDTDRLGQDKGHAAALAAFVAAVKSGGPAPVDESELIETSRATLAVLDSLRRGERIVL